MDVFAPGKNIRSSWHQSDMDTKTISGTSMASPHVAGVMAVLLSEKDMTPAQMKALLVRSATDGKISGLSADTVNKLLFLLNSDLSL